MIGGEAYSRFTGMPVDAYIATDFNGFVDAVDAVGCGNIDLPAVIYDPSYRLPFPILLGS